MKEDPAQFLLSLVRGMQRKHPLGLRAPPYQFGLCITSFPEGGLGLYSQGGNLHGSRDFCRIPLPFVPSMLLLLPAAIAIRSSNGPSC